jgi:hypothetical protein
VLGNFATDRNATLIEVNDIANCQLIRDSLYEETWKDERN